MSPMNMNWLTRIRRRAERPATIHDMVRGLSPAPMIHPPARPRQVAALETRLGFALPPLFRQLLLEVGDGGYGPGYGLIGVQRAPGREDLAQVYAQSHAVNPTRRGYFPLLPKRLVPVVNWGCGIYACLDCRSRTAPVYFFNPDLHVLDDPGLEARLISAAGDVVWTFKPRPAAPPGRPRQPRGQTRLFLQASSFEAWIGDWARGVKLWNAMERLLATL